MANTILDTVLTHQHATGHTLGLLLDTTLAFDTAALVRRHQEFMDGIACTLRQQAADRESMRLVLEDQRHWRAALELITRPVVPPVDWTALTRALPALLVDLAGHGRTRPPAQARHRGETRRG